MQEDNVYRKIELFYQKKKQPGRIVGKVKMERYFREMAWQGKKDVLLRRMFGVISALLSYMARRRLWTFHHLTPHDFVEAFYSYADTRPKLRLIEQNVNMFYGYLEEFLRAMAPDGDEILAALRESRQLFGDGDAFSLPDRQEYDAFCDVLEHAPVLGDAELDHLNEILDSLVVGMIEYFRRDEARPDFSRAVMLYAGPLADPEKEGEDWWTGFWDYFFFDYHRREDDMPPGRYYLEREKDRLSAAQRYVLRDLMRAKLKVFTVDYIDDEMAACTDLFSGENIELPCPGNAFPDFRNMIFFGHLQRRGIMLLNYITGFSAGRRLRRRIRDEINRQFEWFRAYQMPHATLDDFFLRHGAAVRHTVQLMSCFAQLRVVPDFDGGPWARGIASAALLAPEEARLEEAARALGFSAYSIFFAKRLYEDYAAKTKRRGTGAVLAAVLLLIENVNGVEYAPVGKIVSAFGARQDDVMKAVDDVGKTVGCVATDPRYLTEEGYVQLLYLA